MIKDQLQYFQYRFVTQFVLKGHKQHLNWIPISAYMQQMQPGFRCQKTFRLTRFREQVPQSLHEM